jgi:hypothetical protein
LGKKQAQLTVVVVAVVVVVVFVVVVKRGDRVSAICATM